ncbi:hypothetical protein [Flavobacterium urocaniciphilum]|uniref:Uncharacterized protein n=1 Tax=Flavobacterium urocaniciphilum TaxID=1299341 RepID=A0A1H9BWI1_9FLAO|nr:hypothetical protein [Flavobacterium urocaniciphilum]SEP92708.1 hypothetical protein SAMN05444005_103232 [Flavobacterium urocaniciphilum]
MNKKYKLIARIITLLFIQFNFAQVGIGTTNPQATLHVQGNLRVTNTNNTTTSETLLGNCSQGDITSIKVGEGLMLKDNELSNTNTSSPTKYKIIGVPIVTVAPNQNFDNLNLDLNGANIDVVVFRLAAGHNYTISGISGGVDGRHVIIYNSSAVNLTINNMSSSNPLNHIDTLGSATATSGVGTIEFVYDGMLNKWIVINIRN